MNSVNKISLQSQNTVAIIFLFDSVCLNFLGLFGECVCIHCLDCSGLCIHELYTRLATSHDSVKKFVHLFPKVPKKRQGWPHSLSFVKFSQLFWYPTCTELMVNQSACDSWIQSSPRSLWKFFRKFLYHEMIFSKHALVDFLNVFISNNWASFLTTFIRHISAPISEFSAQFCHTTVFHNIITIYLYMTQSTMNLGRDLSFFVKKTNHSKYLTVGWHIGDSIHISSVITPTVHSENVWG